MREVYSLIWLALVGAFRSRVSLEAENTILRHQLNVLRRQSPKRPTFGMLDRLIFAGLYRLAPKVLGALAIVKPETVIKWHRGYPAAPLVSYQINRQLSGWNLPSLVIRAFGAHCQQRTSSKFR